MIVDIMTLVQHGRCSGHNDTRHTAWPSVDLMTLDIQDITVITWYALRLLGIEHSHINLLLLLLLSVHHY